MLTRRAFRSIAAGTCVAVGILVLTANAAHAATWSNVTVTTTEGWEYPGMTVESTAGDPAILLINAQGGRRSMPRATIRTIVDAAGHDLTDVVFAAEEPDHSPTTDDEAAPRRDPVAHLLLLPSCSVGAIGTGTDAFVGGSLGGALRISTLKNAYIGVDYRRLWVDFESLVSPIYHNLSKSHTHLDELYLVVGVHPRAVRLDKPIAFVEAGVGAVFKRHAGIVAFDVSNNAVYRHYEDTSFGLLLACGAILPLSAGVPGVGVHLGANMRLTGSGGGIYGSEMLFGVTAGFTFLLGDAP